MSGIVKSVKKMFKKVVKSPIFKAIAIAAVVWFTVGTAAAYFAAPEVTLGQAMTSSASSMWATATEFVGLDAATVAQNAAANGTALTGAQVNAAQAGEITSSLSTGTMPEKVVWGVNPANEAASSAAMEQAYGLGGETAAAGGEAAASSGFNPTITGGDMGLGGGPGMGLGGGPDMGLAQFAGPTSAESTGMMSWLKDNPMATLMLGQSLSGAAQSYSMEKAASDDRAFERERLANRGLGGFDSQGNYAGIVSSQQAPTPESAVAEPVVQKPQVAAIQPQTVAPIQTPTQTPAPPQQQTVPVSRDQLPKLNQSGQIARG